ncbi:hypothetical protein [Pontibacter fetidus]|uniref:DUF4157 domain-containing protein n=1 Tax=Pontibacter fetidus TaxID=2700082 RepID=A0A6B2H909_9BACT|nr:hypothetical protein [Pontibacter fetidus]NDK57147.1 hypothetical protein [Pontibacter fetidus]
MHYKIVEKSLFARIARMVLKSSNVAMVIGNKIHLSGVDKHTFERDEGWLAHELCHIRQFQEHGYFRFLWLYLKESYNVGYYNNKYEVEAREAGSKHKRHQAATKKETGNVKPSGLPLPSDVKKEV